MLKIRDQQGKVVGVLKDEDSEPEMLQEETHKCPNCNCGCHEEQEKEGEEDADVD